MFSEASIIALLEPTGYTIEETPDKQYDIHGENDIRLPIVYVGYANIDSNISPNEVNFNYLNLHGENETQYFDVQIVCEKVDLVDIRIATHQALVGKLPVGQIQDTTVLQHNQGGLIGKNNGIIHWLDRYQIRFPTIFTLY